MLCTLNGELENLKMVFKKNRTAQLWLQYLDLIGILRRFIRAERLGDWKLHLQSLNEMLPWFAASGHYLYTKSVWLYLQDMARLKDHFPTVYQTFCNQNHVVHTQSKFTWKGMGCDKAIECFLMKEVKGDGGLTSGTGFDTVQRNTYLYSRPTCAEISSAIEQITGVSHDTSEQHKELRSSRLTRDSKDCGELEIFFSMSTTLSPKHHEKHDLYNIFTGTTAHNAVNIDNARQIGCSIIDEMRNQTVYGYKFEKSSQAKNLSMKLKLKDKDNGVEVDPALLFQRLSAIFLGKRYDELDLSKFFSDKLCPYPASLAKSASSLNIPTKPALVEKLKYLSVESYSHSFNISMVYVIDGGYLLRTMVKAE